MKRITSFFTPLTIVCLLLFALHQLMVRVWHIHIEWLDNWLDPLVFMPVFLRGLAVEGWVWGDRKTLGATDVFSAVIYISLLVEGLFPLMSPRFTADWIDVLCYLLGGLAYLWAHGGSENDIIDHTE
ncbi:hypothetical protein [Parasegetibacter sp. NRK P23]|uniref:hypothetical protein n=1 Tax=Parasegetibacter sp. NRK P23 TaxID=2942999 RepID=UPI0020437D18|nr:hypothetical protein [Parasegetibacter sp. NRK P23]MCM5530239.1 hypothetical protein [Parasegetibacter sp. NRK P23]